jgi:acyl-CoA dehydrogenase
MVYLAAWKKDQNMNATRECSMAKLFATEVAQRVATEAVQIMGGRSVTIGEKVELLYRMIRTCSIYEGTSEIQKITIARQLLAEDTFTTLP